MVRHRPIKHIWKNKHYKDTLTGRCIHQDSFQTAWFLRRNFFPNVGEQLYHRLDTALNKWTAYFHSGMVERWTVNDVKPSNAENVNVVKYLHTDDCFVPNGHQIQTVIGCALFQSAVNNTTEPTDKKKKMSPGLCV